MPSLETLREVADWAIWDANNPTLRRNLIPFRQRMNTLVLALQLADKYGIEVYVSY